MDGRCFPARCATLVEDPAYSLERSIKTSKVLLEAQSLRARYVEKHLQWLELLVPNIERRLGVEPGPVPDTRAQAIVASARALVRTTVPFGSAHIPN
jgi:hypothetical protein